MFTIVALLREKHPGFKHYSIAASGVTAGVRETQRIAGMGCMTLESTACAVSRCAHPLDIHSATSQLQQLTLKKCIKSAFYISCDNFRIRHALSFKAESQ